MGKGEEKLYQIEIRRSALKEMRRLPISVRGRVESEINNLVEEPFPTGVKKLIGGKDIYRIRIGDYRIVYNADFENRLIMVERIRHRREAYH